MSGAISSNGNSVSNLTSSGGAGDTCERANKSHGEVPVVAHALFVV